MSRTGNKRDREDGPCGKVIFASRAGARRCVAGKRTGGFRIGVYFCRACRGWHVTNRDKSRGETGRDNRPRT